MIYGYFSAEQSSLADKSGKICPAPGSSRLSRLSHSWFMFQQFPSHRPRARPIQGIGRYMFLQFIAKMRRSSAHLAAKKIVISLTNRCMPNLSYRSKRTVILAPSPACPKVEFIFPQAGTLMLERHIVEGASYMALCYSA